MLAMLAPQACALSCRPHTTSLPLSLPHALLQAVNQIGYVEPPPHSDARATRLRCNPLRPLLSSLRLVPTMPRRVRGVLASVFFLFLTWFTTWLYLPAFMGVEVFGGSPDAALPDDDPAKIAYSEGARAYSLGMAGACHPRLLSRTRAGCPALSPWPCRRARHPPTPRTPRTAGAAVVTLVCAPTLPAASRRWGEGRVLLALELLHAALLLATAFVTQRALAIAAIAGLGLPFAGLLVIPYSIVGRAAAKTSGAGQYMATMNLFLCLPELLVSLAARPAR